MQGGTKGGTKRLFRRGRPRAAVSWGVWGCGGPCGGGPTPAGGRASPPPPARPSRGGGPRHAPHATTSTPLGGGWWEKGTAPPLSPHLSYSFFLTSHPPSPVLARPRPSSLPMAPPPDVARSIPLPPPPFPFASGSLSPVKTGAPQGLASRALDRLGAGTGPDCSGAWVRPGGGPRHGFATASLARDPRCGCRGCSSQRTPQWARRRRRRRRRGGGGVNPAGAVHGMPRVVRWKKSRQLR